MVIWRTPWTEGELVIARESEGDLTVPSFDDVPFRREDWPAVDAAVREVAAAGGELYLAADREVLRVQNLFGEEVSLHWLHRPHSWAAVPVDGLEQAWPDDLGSLPVVRTPEYAEMSARYGPGHLDRRVPCPCEVLRPRPEDLETGRSFGLEVTPQSVWDRRAGPFDGRSVAAWADRLELYECSRCQARWGAAQVNDGLVIRYESRRLTDRAFDRLLRAAAP